MSQNKIQFQEIFQENFQEIFLRASAISAKRVNGSYLASSWEQVARFLSRVS